MKDTTSNKWYGDFKWIAIENSRSFSEPKDFTHKLMSYFMKFFESNLQGIYNFFGPDHINT